MVTSVSFPDHTGKRSIFLSHNDQELDGKKSFKERKGVGYLFYVFLSTIKRLRGRSCLQRPPTRSDGYYILWTRRLSF